MDPKLLEHYLSEMEDHVNTARLRVARQAEVLRLMKLEGKDVAAAVKLMTQFERVLTALEGVLRQLGRELPSAARDD